MVSSCEEVEAGAAPAVVDVGGAACGARRPANARRKLLLLVGTGVAALAGFALLREADRFVHVAGGAFQNQRSIHHGTKLTLPSFWMGRYEVTQKEWTEVMGNNPSQFRGENLPVEMVSWYDCIEYCNNRSVKEGLEPCYRVDKERKDPNNKTEMDDVKWTVAVNSEANGYRLPTEAEWEYAAGGGQRSASYACSGSDVVGDVAWQWQNAGDQILMGGWNWAAIERNNNRTHVVGTRKPNELGLYDMSGNVREWCWDWYGELEGGGSPPEASSRETGRVWKGGGWIGGEHCCESSFRSSFEASGKGPDQGFRVCRSE